MRKWVGGGKVIFCLPGEEFLFDNSTHRARRPPMGSAHRHTPTVGALMYATPPADFTGNVWYKHGINMV